MLVRALSQDPQLRRGATMMWRLLVICLLSGQALCCIQCDRRGRDAIDDFMNFIHDKVLDVETQEYNTLRHHANAAQKVIMDYLEDEVKILDKQAISEIADEYKIAVGIIEKLKDTDVQLLHTIQDQFQKLKDKIKHIVKDAERRRCPNKLDIDNCGLMVQTYIQCMSCEEEKIICAGGHPENQESFDKCSCVCTQKRCFDLKTGFECSPCKDPPSHLTNTIDCGERHLSVIEEEDVVLECNFDWFARLEEGHKTMFDMPRRPAPLITDEPFMRLNEIQMYESGTYICTTYLYSGVPVAKVIYNVKVVSGSKRGTHENHQPLPPLPDDLELSMLEEPLNVGPKVKNKPT
ncbi:uncharacterized protein LOC130301974 isoform X1 [Hyla sarda]|uniref:uncharacterized protein LOC130301974 isoform X1 n=2 Tax=Hyla sarda TaxID=327740 RepID=UPI0024C31D0E|nr:uncharacterized protein LOC130301974 isoform X1 [Hyla sarda]